MVAGNTRLTGLMNKMGKAKAWVFDIPSSINERSAKEVAADEGPTPKEKDGREVLDKSDNPKYKRLMTIGRARYPYAKTDMEMLASWFYDVDTKAKEREDDLEAAGKENDSAINFIELQVSDLNDELEKMQKEILNISSADEKKKSIYSSRQTESINEIHNLYVSRSQTGAELSSPDDEITIVGKLKNGMKVGIEYNPDDKANLEVSLYGNQKKPVIVGKIDLRKEGATYVSAYSRLSRKYQGQGLGLQLYQFVITEMGILLKSDLTQSKGSQSVWRKLALTPGINVYGFRAVPGKKREYFTVAPDELNQLNGYFQVYDNEEVEDIANDLDEYETEVMHQEAEGRISKTEAQKRINKERAKAKKEITEFEKAGNYTWLLATSKKEKAKKLESVNGRMRILALVEDDEPKPEVYVDMDGVLVDFFSEWAKMNGVDNWREIEPKMKSQGKTLEDALDLIRQSKDFWINLKPSSGINELLDGIKKHVGSYTVLSSPLSNDPTSEPQKREWVKNNLGAFPPKKVIIFKNKAKYATQADGTPNILIDDYSNQINPWKSAGGIGIKHSNSKVSNSIAQLEQSFDESDEVAPKNRGSALVEKDTPKPEVYVDMNHVLFDLNNLKPALGINELLTGIKKYAGSYTILSSPLSNDPTSEPQKREWVKNNLASFPPKKVIIVKSKETYATQADGTPNILINYDSQQIRPWNAAGGIGIKHSNSKVSNSVTQLQQAFGNVEQSTTDRGSFTSKSKAHDINVRSGGQTAGDKIKQSIAKGAEFGRGFGSTRRRQKEGFEIELPSKKKRKKTDKDWSLLRLALEDNIMLEKANGDCFLVAGRAILNADELMEANGFKLIHALVTGEGDLEGRKFFHAFNMLGDVVFDNSNGNNITTRKEIYFNQGGVDPNLKGGFATYNKEEALINMAQNMHWGPWDLDDSLEEDLPDSKGEIGKEKLRISSSELEVIKSELTTEENVKVKWDNFKNGKMARSS